MKPKRCPRRRRCIRRHCGRSFGQLWEFLRWLRLQTQLCTECPQLVEKACIWSYHWARFHERCHRRIGVQALRQHEVRCDQRSGPRAALHAVDEDSARRRAPEAVVDELVRALKVSRDVHGRRIVRLNDHPLDVIAQLKQALDAHRNREDVGDAEVFKYGRTRRCMN
jgi:hypothetical protein